MKTKTTLFVLLLNISFIALAQTEKWKWKKLAVGKNAGNETAGSVMMSDVIQIDSTTYRMYYGAALPGQQTAIKYAESSDGINWAVKGFALQGAADTADREHVISGPSLVKLPNDSIRMYYQSSPQQPVGQSPKFHVRSAISSDGINWTREGIRIDIDSFDASSTLRLAGHGTYFIAKNGTYVGIFSGEFSTDPMGPSDLKMGTSTDGLTWGNFQTLYTDWHDPIVIRKDTDDYVLYATYLLEKQGKAVSADGINWQTQPDSIVFDSAGYRMTEQNSGVGDIGGVVLASGKILLYANYGNPSSDIAVFETDSAMTVFKEISGERNETVKISPNPFFYQTTITYSLATDAQINIELYNLLGEKVKTIADEKQGAGEHRYLLNLEKESSEICFLKVKVNDEFFVKKIISIQ